MSVSYLSCFDLRRITWGITLTPLSGGSPITINSDSFAKPCHLHGPAGIGVYAIASGDGTDLIEDEPGNDAKYGELTFGSFVAFYANALASGWSTPTVLSFAFSMTTLRYTISRSSGDSFAISFTGDGAALFGFSGSSASATTHTGTRTPLFALRASSPGLSADSGDYEPGGQSSTAMSDSCATWHGQARSSSPVYRDWEQRFEAPQYTWRDAATSAAPWTFQDLFRLARSGLPFVAHDSLMSTHGLYLLRSEGVEFRPIPASEGNHAQLHVPFRCAKIGKRSN